MRILVTGANGFLGHHLVRLLLEKGFPVKVWIRPGSDISGLKDLSCSLCFGWLEDSDALARAMKNCQAVVHSAAVTAQWPTRFSFYRKGNVEGTVSVLEAARKAGIERFVYVSTANTFRPGSKDKPGTELQPLPEFMYRSGYALSKLLAQETVLSCVRKTGFPAVVVNPSFLIGPEDRPSGSTSSLLKLLSGRLRFCPPGGKSFVSVRSAAEGILKALSLGRKGECYLLSGENLTYREFLERTAGWAGKKVMFCPLPALILKTMGVLCGAAEGLTGRVLPLNRINARQLCLDNYFSYKKAETLLGWCPGDLDAEIVNSLKWASCL